MGGFRKFRREVIRNKCRTENGSTKSFGYEWRKYMRSKKKKLEEKEKQSVLSKAKTKLNNLFN